MNKRQLAFILVNILLIGAVGLIVGLCLPVTSNTSLLTSFILLLVTLALPSFIYFLVKDATSGFGIASILFGVGNLATLITFMSMYQQIDVKVVGITEGAILGAFLILSLIIIATLPKKEEK